MFRVGIDLGGTNIAVGVVNENYEIAGRGKVKTRAPRPAGEIAKDIKVAVDMALQDAGVKIDDIASIGIGAPGSVNPETGVIGFFQTILVLLMFRSSQCLRSCFQKKFL